MRQLYGLHFDKVIGKSRDIAHVTLAHFIPKSDADQFIQYLYVALVQLIDVTPNDAFVVFSGHLERTSALRP